MHWVPKLSTILLTLELTCAAIIGRGFKDCLQGLGWKRVKIVAQKESENWPGLQDHLKLGYQIGIAATANVTLTGLDYNLDDIYPLVVIASSTESWKSAIDCALKRPSFLTFVIVDDITNHSVAR